MTGRRWLRFFCRVGLVLYAIAFGLSLIVFAAGTWGLFGADRDPLAGIFLIPLGFPWSLVLGFAPDPFPFWLGIAAPALNLYILYHLCKTLGGSHANPETKRP